MTVKSGNAWRCVHFVPAEHPFPGSGRAVTRKLFSITHTVGEGFFQSDKSLTNMMNFTIKLGVTPGGHYPFEGPICNNPVLPGERFENY